MIDYLVQSILSNCVVAGVLAAIAWCVQRRVRSASLANLLWALVLVKLVTPPVLSIEFFEVPRVGSYQASESNDQSQRAGSPLPDRPGDPRRKKPTRGLEFDNASLGSFTNQRSVEEDVSLASVGTKENASAPKFAMAFTKDDALSPSLLMIVWIILSVALLCISLFRILRFHRLLILSAEFEPSLTSRYAAPAASALGLRSSPPVYVTPANIAPFVWWSAGRSIVVVPRHSVDKLSSNDLHLIISHELAHIKRRDHWFRWIEWLSLITLWWNPVMWFARQQLRVSEELACDELVLESQQAGVKQYANSLLNMAELLTEPALRPPAVASAINSGGNLENRLKMMIAKNSWRTPTQLRFAILGVAICVFPFGFVYAQDLDAVEKRLAGAVESGELSLDQAHLMMEALKRSIAGAEDEARHLPHDHHRHEMEAMERELHARERAEQMRLEQREREFEERERHERSAELERMKAQLMEVEQDLKAAVEAGDVSAREAKEKLFAMREALRAQMEGRHREDARREREMEARKAEWMELERRLHRAVDAGEISEEEAHRKMLAAKEELFGEDHEPSRHMHEREMEAKEKHYLELERKIAMAVEAGDLSERDAEKKRHEIQRELFGRHFPEEHEEHESWDDEHEEHEHGEHNEDGRDGGDHDDERHEHGDHDGEHDHADLELDHMEMRAKKAKLESIARKLKLAHDKGDLSREDLQRKLIEIEQELFGVQHEGVHAEVEREIESTKARYVELSRAVKNAVGSGEISAEDGERKLSEIRQQMFGQEDDERKQNRYQLLMDEKKARYQELARDAEEAVERGKVSAEAAERKLMEIRLKMFGSDDEWEDTEHADHEMEEKKARYNEISAKLSMALKAGKISAEEAASELNEVRRKMFGPHDHDEEEHNEEEHGDDHHDDAEGREEDGEFAVERRFEEIAHEIEAAVKAGKMPEDEAETTLRELRRRHERFRNSRAARRSIEQRKAIYQDQLHEIMEAVEAGKIREKDAEKKVIQLRREIFGRDR